MLLTKSNYYSKEANKEYISTSQYIDFIGTWANPGCEARAIAKLRGEWEDEVTTAMLVGSYVDAYFEGTLDFFKEKHPKCFKQNGGLKIEFQKAEEIIRRIERDEFFMLCMSGKKQVILTANLFGVMWKGKLDVYHDRHSQYHSIIDLKVMKNLRENFWVKELGQYVTFVDWRGYHLQGAIYQLLEQSNFGGEKAPFYIAAVDKQKVIDIDVIYLNQVDLDKALDGIELNVKRILELKAGRIEPVRCEKCNYCKFTKKLAVPISVHMLMT